jgi:hypothetical protein
MNKWLKATENFNIQLFVGDEEVPFPVSYEQFQEKVTSLGFTGIESICLDLDIIAATHYEETFRLHLLKSMTESKYQSEVLTPLSQNADLKCLDCHSSNVLAKYLCVSPVNAASLIEFNDKPDSIMSIGPVILEVKSRLHADNTEVRVESMSIDDQPSRDNVTGTEMNIIQQSFQRLLAHIQFRSYLTKLIVLASTGHQNYVMYFTQDSSSLVKKIKIRRITSEQVDLIWRSIVDHANNNRSFHLTTDAPLIFGALRRLTSFDLHAVRVQVAAKSRSTVYYVTLPTNARVLKVPLTKLYAFKVIHDSASFRKEVGLLQSILQTWKSEGIAAQFYYRGYYDHSINEVVLDDEVKNKLETQRCSYDWLGLDESLNGTGGVIIMNAGKRDKLELCADTHGQIFADLYYCLRICHKSGIVHRDIRPANCVKFGDCWQLIDFDLAERVDESGSCETKLNTTSHQFKSSGFSIKQQAPSVVSVGLGQESTLSTVGFADNTTELVTQWSFSDDVEMLHLSTATKKVS